MQHKKAVTSGRGEHRAATLEVKESQHADSNSNTFSPMPLYAGSGIDMRAEGDTLYVVGDIDLHQASFFRTRAEEHIRTAPQPRLDLSKVPFMDSAGLSVLLVVARLAQELGKPLRVVAAGSPRRVLRITGIDRVVTVED